MDSRGLNWKGAAAAFLIQSCMHALCNGGRTKAPLFPGAGNPLACISSQSTSVPLQGCFFCSSAIARDDREIPAAGTGTPSCPAVCWRLETASSYTVLVYLLPFASPTLSLLPHSRLSRSLSPAPAHVVVTRRSTHVFASHILHVLLILSECSRLLSRVSIQAPGQLVLVRANSCRISDIRKSTTPPYFLLPDGTVPLLVRYIKR